MHDSVHAWCRHVLDPAWITGRDVAEAGALDVNGSMRPWVEAYRPKSYTGYDIQAGPGVDRILDAEAMPEESADLVISTEMLEHAQYWQLALQGMIAALRTGGVLLLTTRGPGFGRHDYPGDYWRFTCPIMARTLVTNCGLELERLEPDPDFPGVFALARQPEARIPAWTGGPQAWPVV